MSEFVEVQLERLLPAFESLKSSKLYTSAEVDDIIKKCRRYEYSVSKRTKEQKDYFDYADYLAELVHEIECRRKKIRFFHYSANIEKALKYKGGFLHRLAEERFKSESVFRREIDYLQAVNLLGLLSEAYTRLLQFYGHNPRYHEEAGIFEFFRNKSAENARAVLHSALRRFPDDVWLWLALFKVEIGFANLVRKRVRRLQSGLTKKRKRVGKDAAEDQDNSTDDDENENPLPDGDSDAVINLKLAELAYKQARQKLSGAAEIEFIYEAWRVAAVERNSAGDLAQSIFNDLAAISPPADEFVLAQCQRDQKLESYDLYEAALARQQTEKMCRLYIKYCDGRLEIDAFAKTKLSELLSLLDKLNVATSADYDRLLALSGENEEKLRRTLIKKPNDASVWERLIALRIRKFLNSNDEPSEESAEFGEINGLVDEALGKVGVEERLGIWKRFLEVACAVILSSKKLDKIFSRAFSSNTPKIAAELRAVRLAYLAEGCLAAAESGDERSKSEKLKVLRSAYQEMAKIRPSALSMHQKFIEVEEQLGFTDSKLIESALENIVVEFGNSSVDVWLQYLRFQLRNSPNKVGLLYKRAMVNLDGSLVDELNERWTLAISNP